MSNDHLSSFQHTFESLNSSYIELHSFYSENLTPQIDFTQPPLLGISRYEETKHPNLSSDDLLVEQLLLQPKKDSDFPTGDTLQSLVQSCHCDDRLQENSIRSSGDRIREPNGIISESSRNSSKCSILSFEKSIDCSKSQQKQQPQVSSVGTKFSSSSNVVSEKEATKNKTRIHWTEDLHKKFIDSVDRLGGAKKATPKQILKQMNCSRLTIFHVKSHLQKYRFAQLMPDSTQGNSEQLDSRTYDGIQIVEALRLQMDVQRRLYEQLKSQKKLQMRIEEQAKELKAMVQCQLKTKQLICVSDHEE